MAREGWAQAIGHKAAAQGLGPRRGPGPNGLGPGPALSGHVLAMCGPIPRCCIDKGGAMEDLFPEEISCVATTMCTTNMHKKKCVQNVYSKRNGLEDKIKENVLYTINIPTLDRPRQLEFLFLFPM